MVPTQNLIRAQRVNDLLANMWKHYNIEGTLPVIRPQNMKSIQDLVYKQVEHISNQIGYAYCQFKATDALKILELLPKIKQVLCIQKWCKKFLGMKNFVKDFCHLLPLADAKTVIKDQGLRKTGLRLIDTLKLGTEDKSSPIRPGFVAKFIFEELKKKRDERHYRRNLYRNFWKFFEYCKLIVAVVLGLSIAICLVRYEFYEVWDFKKKVREKNGEGKFEEPRVDAGP